MYHHDHDDNYDDHGGYDHENMIIRALQEKRVLHNCIMMITMTIMIMVVMIKEYDYQSIARKARLTQEIKKDGQQSC